MKRAARLLTAVTFLLIVLSLAAPRDTQGTSSSGEEYVTGKVTSKAMRPVPSVWVIVFEGGNQKGRSLTGDDGSYYIGGLESKTYQLVVKKQLNGSDLVTGQVTLPRDRVYNFRLPE